MKIQKRLSALLLTLLVSCALVLSTTFAYAAQAGVDWTQNGSGSITVHMTYQGRPVSGGYLTLYKVGNISQGDSGFTLTREFSGMRGVNLGNFSSDQSAELAQSLARYAARRGIQGRTERVGSDGKATFDSLSFGLYLVVQYEPASGFEPISPFLVSVPLYENGKYEYDVDATPKMEEPDQPTTPPGGGGGEKPDEPSSSTPETSQPETSQPESSQPESSQPESSQPESSQPESSQPESSQPESSQPGESSEPTSSEPGSTPAGSTPGGTTPGGNTPGGGTTPGGNTPGGGTTPGGGSSTPTLPQTGQLNWPIPVFVVAGLSLILVGWGVNYNSKSRKSHEA